jgi:phosphate transport system substrate-binding protein
MTSNFRPAWAFTLLCAVVAAACDTSPNPAAAVAHLQASAPAGAGTLSGSVTLDGSNTVYPVSLGMARAFRDVHPEVQISVEVSGTGGGFEKFCDGKIDIADASRPINAREGERCKTHGVDYMELPIAFDGLAVVVSAKNTFVDCLKLSELKTIWEPAAEGHIQTWKQVRSSFPDAPLALRGKGKASGTFDYFTLAVVGTESSSRGDYLATEDDAAIAQQVAADPNALGYFGYAKYLAARGELKLVGIDAGKGCVEPTAATVSRGTYQPLSRPLFLYVSQSAAARPQVAAFARFYLDPRSTSIIQGSGYVPLSSVSQLAAGARLERHILGSALGGRGSVLGVTMDRFQEPEAVANALVQ